MGDIVKGLLGGLSKYLEWAALAVAIGMLMWLSWGLYHNGKLAQATKDQPLVTSVVVQGASLKVSSTLQHSLDTLKVERLRSQNETNRLTLEANANVYAYRYGQGEVNAHPIPQPLQSADPRTGSQRVPQHQDTGAQTEIVFIEQGLVDAYLTGLRQIRGIQ